MYAVVESGGKQYRVSEGQTVKLERLPYEVGQEVELNRVLLVAGEEGVRVGRPILEGVKVLGTVIEQDLDRKVIIFKYRAKENYRRKGGHRQQYTRLRIDKIIG